MMPRQPHRKGYAVSGKALALTAVLAALLAAGPAKAQGFSGTDLLAWSPENQGFYFETSVTMAGVIVAQKNRELARCLDDWNQRQHEKKYKKILEAIRTYPTYHPQGVILAVLRKACGSF